MSYRAARQKDNIGKERKRRLLTLFVVCGNWRSSKRLGRSRLFMYQRTDLSSRTTELIIESNQKKKGKRERLVTGGEKSKGWRRTSIRKK